MQTEFTAFNHDIFISYRHNDNKPPGGKEGEGWVTEFVNHLTTELETIVKGGISIYFDKNPHTGLLETDQVEKSLAGRLQSLIFIPILSQTYCDQDCYAWKNEFLPFLEKAEHDKLGLSVKLQNGNVASRVLPVCIHELEPADLNLVEEQLHGKLRAISFIFRSAGVNRPMRAKEDDPLKNINHTTYRDQINKVAQAIKEIIQSAKSPEKNSLRGVVDLKRKAPSLLDGLAPSISSVKSITVIPLVFKSSDPEEEFLSQGFAEDLFTSLKQVRALRLNIQGLLGVTDSDQHSVPASVLTGNMTIDEESHQVKIQVRLLQSRTDTVSWQGDYQCQRIELFSIKERITLQVCEFLKITLKETERRAIHVDANVNPAAMELFWKGRYHWRRRGNNLITSMECFQKATDIDPEFAQAHAGIANTSALLGYYEMIPLDESIRKCKESAMRALSIDPTVVDAYFALAYVSLCFEWAWPEAEHNFNKVFNINPNSSAASTKFKLCLTQIASGFEEAEMELPGSAPHFLQAYALIHKGKFEEGLKVAQIASRKDPGSFMAQRAIGLCYMGMGFEKEAIEALNVAAQLSNRHLLVLFDLISAHASKANNGEAMEITEEAMERVNALPARINDFFFQQM